MAFLRGPKQLGGKMPAHPPAGPTRLLVTPSALFQREDRGLPEIEPHRFDLATHQQCGQRPELGFVAHDHQRLVRLFEPVGDPRRVVLRQQPGDLDGPRVESEPLDEWCRQSPNVVQGRRLAPPGRRVFTPT